MRLQLDANAFLWWVTGSARLSAAARDAISDDVNSIFVGVGSLWELAVKRSLGKLDFPHDFQTVLRDEAFDLLPITYDHLRVLEGLPSHHRDPFDRLLIAQSIADDLIVVTSGQKFASYNIRVLW